jgi:hypothetical protein
MWLLGKTVLPYFEISLSENGELQILIINNILGLLSTLRTNTFASLRAAVRRAAIHFCDEKDRVKLLWKDWIASSPSAHRNDAGKILSA